MATTLQDTYFYFHFPVQKAEAKCHLPKVTLKVVLELDEEAGFQTLSTGARHLPKGQHGL